MPAGRTVLAPGAPILSRNLYAEEPYGVSDAGGEVFADGEPGGAERHRGRGGDHRGSAANGHLRDISQSRHRTKRHAEPDVAAVLSVSAHRVLFNRC